MTTKMRSLICPNVVAQILQRVSVWISHWRQAFPEEIMVPGGPEMEHAKA
jgi:hypothetical protein